MCPLLSLDELCVDMVMSFLDRRTLLAFSACHKRFGAIVSYEHVVAAAGATESPKLCEIVKKIQEQAVEQGEIFMPSPQRLLRLINVVRCELCRQRLVSRATCGLFVCRECEETLLIRSKPPRVRLCAPFQDASGEFAGPCKLALEASFNETDASERERRHRAMHVERIGWTDEQAVAFSLLYGTRVYKVPALLILADEATTTTTTGNNSQLLRSHSSMSSLESSGE